MPSTLLAKTGKTHRIKIGATTLVGFFEYDIQLPISDHDVTNMESDTVSMEAADYLVAERVGDVIDGTVKLTGYWNAAQNPHDSPPDFRSGEYLDDVTIYIDRSNDVAFVFEQLFVRNGGVTGGIRKVCQIAVDATVNGAFTYPEGSL